MTPEQYARLKVEQHELAELLRQPAHRDNALLRQRHAQVVALMYGEDLRRLERRSA